MEFVMSSKDERRERWNRKKAHKTRKAKAGFVSGNKRFNRSNVQDVDQDVSVYDQRMGRSSEAA